MLTMFYPPKDITPLNLDLRELPVGNGSHNFDAITTDGVPVGFRFDHGWLTVRISERGGTQQYFEMNNVIFERPVAGTWTIDTYANQICALLGITVNGQKIEHPKTIPHWTAADLSGKTTYWQSGHKTMSADDMINFIDKVKKTYKDCFLYQKARQAGEQKLRLRKIDFLLDDDRDITIAFGCNQKQFDAAIQERDQETIPFKINIFKKISSDKAVTYRDLVLKDYTGARNFKVMACTHYVIHASFNTDDVFSKNTMDSFIKLLNEHFLSGLKAFNVETGDFVMDVVDPIDDINYSIAVKDWCLDKDTNYIQAIKQQIPDWSKPVLLGYRPA